MTNATSQDNIYKIQWCFGDSLKKQKPPGPITGLLSYPNSGNTWIRYLIQKSTGYVTGSVYFSSLLYDNGFPGEGMDNGSSIVIKSHLNAFREVTLMKQSNTAIQLPIRIGKNV